MLEFYGIDLFVIVHTCKAICLYNLLQKLDFQRDFHLWKDLQHKKGAETEMKIKLGNFYPLYVFPIKFT